MSNDEVLSPPRNRAAEESTATTTAAAATSTTTTASTVNNTINDAVAPPTTRGRKKSRGMVADFYTSLRPYSRAEKLVLLAFGLFIIALVMLRLQYSTQSVCCGDFDGYYHIKWSRMLWDGFKQGRLPQFTSLPFTTLNPKDYVDHHFLFHVLQIPFTWFADMRAGAKIGAFLFATFGVFACYWLIVKENLSYAPVWLIALLASSSSFLFRINMTKAMSLSLVCCILGIYLLFRRQYVWLAPLGFIYVWLYSLWVLLPVTGAIWMLVLLYSEGRIEWRVVLWISVGVIAGLVINPYFPHNFRLLYEHILMKAGAGEFETKVGGEWYPWDTNQFISACRLALAAMVAGFIAFDWSDKRRAERPLFFMLFASLMMLATMYQKRYSEYFPPLAILFAAFALQNVFENSRQSLARLPNAVMEELQPFLDSGLTPVENWRARSLRVDLEAAITGLAIAGALFLLSSEAPFEPRVRMILTALAAAAVFTGLVVYAFRRHRQQAILIGITVLLGATMFNAIRTETIEISDSPEPARYEATMNWISRNVPEGEQVFNTDWDDFPKIFFYSHKHPIVSGLDPTYLLYENPDLFHVYENITLGKVDEAAPLIREKFGARYIFTDKKPRNDGDMNDFYFKLMESGWVDEVFDDGEHSTVLKIRDQRGANAVNGGAENNAENDGDENDEATNDDESANDEAASNEAANDNAASGTLDNK